MAITCPDPHESPDGSSIVQDYLKVVLEIGRQRTDRMARTGAVAKHLGVSPGTVTSMFKRLADAGSLTYQPYRGARLTDVGMYAACQVVHRHQIVEFFFAHILGLNEQDAHADAERLEHCVSDKLVSRMDAILRERKAAVVDRIEDGSVAVVKMGDDGEAWVPMATLVRAGR